MVEYIKIDGKILSVIVRNNYSEPGIHFFTGDNYSQQLAYMNHPKGKSIQPHVHNCIVRNVEYTQEVLFIKKGKLRVDFYDENKIYCESRILAEGDIILLATGGHGFEVLEDIEMVEVKQGPYSGEGDKTRFNGVEKSKINIIE
ncbi:MAG: hypothetical protein NTX44_10985 [Ignavibacteriales bacterium]|nr:hypothetical protein [Ignavibacteriales bacterium]